MQNVICQSAHGNIQWISEVCLKSVEKLTLKKRDSVSIQHGEIKDRRAKV